MQSAVSPVALPPTADPLKMGGGDRPATPADLAGRVPVRIQNRHHDANLSQPAPAPAPPRGQRLVGALLRPLRPAAVLLGAPARRADRRRRRPRPGCAGRLGARAAALRL